MPLVDVPITVTNAQGTDTPAPFQQMIQFNPSLYSFLMSDLSNIRFTDEDYSALPAWLESYSSTSATIWVRLNDGIRAGQSRILHMLIGTVGFDGQFWGEAPQLSPTYGQYDSGANVFNYYTNFAGTTLPSGWFIGGTSNYGNVTINNGAKIVCGTIANFYVVGLFFSGLPSSPPFAVDYAPQQTTSPSGASYTESWAGLVNSTTTYATNPNNKYLLLQFGMGQNAEPMSTFGGSVTYGTLPTPPGNTFVGTFTQLISSSSYYTYYNYTQSTGYITGMSFSSTVGLYWTFEQFGQEGIYAPNGQTIYWFRVRAYPPNGVMPSVTVGSPKIYNYGYIVYPW